MTSPEVAFYPGNWTWNEAFTTCMDRGMLLLNIDNDSTYVALQQLHNKYNNEINRLFHEVERSHIKGKAYLSRLMEVKANMGNTFLHAIEAKFLWLGLHEPSPITDPDIRVWSHCLAPGSTNWDSRRPPSPNQADTALCTVINVTSTLWYTVECTQRHGFVCTGTRATGQWSYDFGTAHNIGAGVSLGPYNVSNVNCERMCNDKEFETQQCWAFTLREGANECHLHFTDDATFENVSVTTVTESYVLYRKLIWKESLHTTTKVAADTGIFPVSCCNVSTIPSLCPSNNVPEFDSDIPTTVKQDLVLHTTPASFSVAFKTCNSYNGHLIRVSQLSKLKLLTRTGHVWIGLTETRPVDPCSLQWTRDCLVPEWTNFLDSTYTSAGNKTCVAIDTTGSFVKRSCSDQLQFLCEIDIGPCDFLDVVPDHLCQVGALGLSYTEPTATCQSTCSTTVHGDMECWNFVKTGPTSCALFFYQDPGQCHDSFTFKRNNDAVFKTCYISSTHSINTDAMLPTIEPLTVCPATSNYPYIPPEKHYCDVSSTSTAILIYPSSSSFSTDDISSSSLIDVSSPVSSSGYIASTSAPDVPFLTSTANVAITTSLLGASFSTPTPDAILSISTSDAILSTSTTDTILSTHETATTVSTSIIDAFILTSLTDSILSTGTRFISSITTTDSIWSAPTSAVNPIAQTTSADKFAVVSATNVIIESSAAEISYSTFSDDIVSSVSSLDDSETTLPLNSIATTYFEMTTDSSFLTETTSLTHASATTSSTAMITTTLRSITPQVSEMTTKPTKYITPIYIWPCLCHLYNKTNLTFEEWEKWLAHTLEMPKNRTKRYMRSKVSVCDTRTSALAIGIITSSLMLGIAIYLLSSDIPRLIKSVKYIHRCNKTEAYRKRANIDTQQKF
ncbi:hypothetical protein MAR_038033 [Mya arenaria]|uniref:C-type lectin domain-containing protein n=1 Tax=Mya arenaria TaxID=6604 RepID=A0ABY7FU27_MYAAR|nr:hypothetical protein MAR_038033 [Mya arenaria]